MDSNHIDQELLTHIVQSLCLKPERVTIERKTDERGVLLQVYADPSDMGKIIGTKGATAQIIRDLMRIVGNVHGSHISVRIGDPRNPTI